MGSPTVLKYAMRLSKDHNALTGLLGDLAEADSRRERMDIEKGFGRLVSRLQADSAAFLAQVRRDIGSDTS